MALPCELELVIDLHGYSFEKAKFCILDTLARAYNVSRIRVITGRGNHINKKGERGTLYKNFRSWLLESAYQSRIEKVMTYDGYYEIQLRGSKSQEFSKLTQCIFNDLFKDIKPITTKADQGDSESQFIAATYLIANAKNDKDFKRAFQYLLEAAKQGYADAMISVARCYLVGRGVKQNDSAAINWLNKALAVNHFEAPLLLGDYYWEKHKPEIAADFYTKSKEPVGKRKLANCFNTGLGRQKNQDEAFRLYKEAADLGEVTSQYNVAVFYENGLKSGLVKPDAELAFKYFLQAAEGGDPEAQCKVGEYYLLGKHVNPDAKLAQYWLNLAAENGSSQALEFLKWYKPDDLDLLQKSSQAGNILDRVSLKLRERKLIADADTLNSLFLESYSELRDLAPNTIINLEQRSKFFLLDNMLIDKSKAYHKKAHEILKSLADQKCIYSLRRLAHVYHNGLGVVKSDKIALDYLKQAYNLKDGKSSSALSDIYKFGEFGVKKSPIEAMNYLKKAADFGYPPANYFLGIYYCENNAILEGIEYLRKAIKLELEKIETDFVFTSGFIDTYLDIKQDAALRIGMELLQSEDEQQVELGFKFVHLAVQWGSDKAKEFFVAMQKEGWHEKLPSEWTTPILISEEELKKMLTINEQSLSLITGDKGPGFFNKSDSLIVIAGKLAGIVIRAEEEGVPCPEDLKDLVMTISPELEGYLNNFDEELLFRRNMGEMLKCNQYVPIIEQDKNLKSKILELINKNNNFNTISVELEKYKEKSPESEFKKSILDEYATFARHYRERKSYKDYAEQQAKFIALAKEINEKAVHFYKDKNFQAALNLFTKVMKYISYSCQKDNELVATSYYNLGRTLFQLKLYPQAKYALECSSVLRGAYFKSNEQEITKVKNAISDCVKAMSELGSSLSY